MIRAAIEDQWRNGINAIWNNKAFFSDGSRLCEIKLACDFVDSGAHQTVNVHAGTGNTNMQNWYLDNPSGWPNQCTTRLRRINGAACRTV